MSTTGLIMEDASPVTQEQAVDGCSRDGRFYSHFEG